MIADRVECAHSGNNHLPFFLFTAVLQSFFYAFYEFLEGISYYSQTLLCIATQSARDPLLM